MSGPSETSSPNRVPVEVVFIGGTGRSGSTLLNQVLGAAPSHCAVGELNNIWRRSFGENHRCTCGKPFRDCEFWSDVTTRALGDVDDTEIERIGALAASVQRRANTVQLVWPRLRRRRLRAALAEYETILNALYAAIADVSGCDVIIDSSKSPGYGCALAASSGIRVRLVHLVRDSRATAFSYAKKRSADGVDERALMPRHGSVYVALHWAFTQAFTTLSARQFERSASLRYEDFAEDPRKTITELGVQLGLDDAAAGFTSDTELHLPPDHSLWGNPSRFAGDVVEVRPDTKWRQGLPRRERWKVTALTLPWLIRYGYVHARAR